VYFYLDVGLAVSCNISYFPVGQAAADHKGHDVLFFLTEPLHSLQNPSVFFLDKVFIFPVNSQPMLLFFIRGIKSVFAAVIKEQVSGNGEEQGWGLLPIPVALKAAGKAFLLVVLI
jgi:hypothetical protein